MNNASGSWCHCWIVPQWIYPNFSITSFLLQLALQHKLWKTDSVIVTQHFGASTVHAATQLVVATSAVCSDQKPSVRLFSKVFLWCEGEACDGNSLTEHYRTFTWQQAAGSLLWAFSFTLSAEVTPSVTKLDGCPSNQPGEKKRNSESNSG